MRPLPPGTTVAEYVVEGVLGRGGMAVVYRAAHPGREEPVALKLISADAWGAETQALLEHESRLAAAVAHRHILPVYEAGLYAGQPYVAMKLERCDLSAILRREGYLAPERAVRYVAQIAAALDAAHAHGLVHRDIKPSNVLVGDDDRGERLAVSDFGVAYAAFSKGSPLGTGLVGTVAYVAPEQIRGDAVDARTDVYALGCLLYECLTGRVPFRRASPIATMWAHLRDDPTPPSDLAPELPAALDAVLDRALRKDPRARFGSAGGLAEAAAEAIQARPRRGANAPRPDLPSGTVTFLFTDVEGSTRLLHELGEEAYAESLAEHRDIVRAACAAEGGVEVDTQGDAFFFAFPTAEGALEAARDFTTRLATTEIAVRVGIHTGTPHLTSEGYVGADVHRAARIGAAGHGGQVLVSEQAAALLEHELVALGSHRLKDFEGSVRIFQALDGSFPPLKTIANSNLPTPASSFLGREAELYEADDLLRRTRLLTIHGPGGQGKTRFALELATRAREERFADYPDGVFVCFLAPLRDPTLVLSTIAQTLSVVERAGESALDALCVQLSGKKLLLVLDNLEHVLECAREFAQLLLACPDLTLLVTSRELLRVDGEVTYALPPLPADDGVALFCERAAVEPTATVAEICARLEGLPLAIELAAARLRLLSPEQLLERLSSRLDLLKGTRDADPRQQTLRATIEWSYDLLSPGEQELFARLSVFAGGCALEAAEDVCSADLDTLESLLDKSLLRRMESDAGPRFWMLETIREFALEKLDASGEAEEVRGRHAGWTADRLFAERVALRSLDAEALRLLDTEQNNARAALEWACDRGAADAARRLMLAVWHPWLVRGNAQEGDQFATRVAGLPSGSSVESAECVATAGEFARFLGDSARAVELKEEALAAFELLPPDDVEAAIGRAWTHGDLSDLFSDRGRFDEAQAHAERALAIWQEVPEDSEWGALAGEAHGLHGLAVVSERRRELQVAANLYEEVATRLEAAGMRLEARAALQSLGDVRRRLGDSVGARAALEQALARAAEGGDVNCRAECHASFGLLAAQEGASDLAVELLSRTLAEVARAALPLDRSRREEVDATLGACRRLIGEERFSAAWDRGTQNEA